MTELFLLFFIYVGEIGLAALIYLAAAVSPHPDLIFFSVYFLQTIFSVVQGGMSDRSCRRKHLLIGFIAIVIAQIFFLFAFTYSWLMLFTVLLYGIFGNVVPISRAAMIDTKLKEDFRLSIGLATVAIALGWFSMMYAVHYCHPLTVCWIVTLVSALAIVLLYFVKDWSRHEEPFWNFEFRKGLKEDFSLLTSLFRHPWVAWAMSGYFVAEIAFYQVFAKKKAGIGDPSVRFVIMTWVVGYCLGVFLQGCIVSDKKEKYGVIAGSAISLLAMIGLIALLMGGYENFYMLTGTNAGFALGFGVFIPCLFSLISKEYGLQVQGKIHGLIDAVDSLALSITAGIIYLAREHPVEYLHMYSLIFIILAIYCFVMTIKRLKRRF